MNHHKTFKKNSVKYNDYDYKSQRKIFQSFNPSIFQSLILKLSNYICVRIKNQDMLQIAFIRENQAKVIQALAKRNMDATTIVEEVVALDENRRATQVELDNTLAESNKLSKDIGALMKSGEKSKAEILKAKTVALKEKSKDLGEKADALADDLLQKLL